MLFHTHTRSTFKAASQKFKQSTKWSATWLFYFPSTNTSIIYFGYVSLCMQTAAVVAIAVDIDAGMCNIFWSCFHLNWYRVCVFFVFHSMIKNTLHWPKKKIHSGIFPHFFLHVDFLITHTHQLSVKLSEIRDDNWLHTTQFTFVFTNFSTVVFYSHEFTRVAAILCHLFSMAIK